VRKEYSYSFSERSGCKLLLTPAVPRIYQKAYL
jgi:hypothetical protein